MRQPLTPFQEPVLRYAIQAAMMFPHPTLATLREILAVHPPATKTYTPPPPIYEKILHKLDPDTQEYFRSTYDTQGPRNSRSEVLNRISTMTSRMRFRRIFNGKTTKLNIASLINEPNVIVINAARSSLESLTEVYGRYFLRSFGMPGLLDRLDAFRVLFMSTSAISLSQTIRLRRISSLVSGKRTSRSCSATRAHGKSRIP